MGQPEAASQLKLPVALKNCPAGERARRRVGKKSGVFIHSKRAHAAARTRGPRNVAGDVLLQAILVPAGARAAAKRSALKRGRPRGHAAAEAEKGGEAGVGQAEAGGAVLERGGRERGGE
jgi:hypothetical protein